MNFNEVKELINIISESNLREFQLNIDNVSVKMSKNNGAVTSNVEESAPKVDVTAAQTAKAVTTDVPITILPETTEKIEGHLIKAPIVGTFYLSSAPDKPPFVKVGDKVKKGDVLCIIEAMKIMNEITSDKDGEIGEVLAGNETMVEFNQPLFKIV